MLFFAGDEPLAPTDSYQDDFSAPVGIEYLERLLIPSEAIPECFLVHLDLVLLNTCNSFHVAESRT